jgi:hypothetical protein
VEVGLYNNTVLSLAVPFVRAKGGDVQDRQLAPTLEVVGPHVGLTPPGCSQCEEEPEQAHRRLHTHAHLTDDGMRRRVVKLETVVLQQREEEGGHWERELGQRIGGKITISPCCKLVSGTALHHILPLNSTVCHPSSRLTHTRTRKEGWRGWTPLLRAVDWIWVMVESSSSSMKEEDREFECKKANEVITICL